MTTERVQAIRIEGGGADGHRPVEECVTAEAPLQIRVNLRPFTTTMRTPGDDRCLARGLLFTEGVILDPAAPLTWREERDPATGAVTALDARAPEAFVQKHRLERRSLIATASCGLCGTVEARDVWITGPALRRGEGERLDAGRIAGMLGAMRAGQRAFAASGGCHAAAAFTRGEALLAVCEDVGRHNAVDKVIGALIEAGQLNMNAHATELGAEIVTHAACESVQFEIRNPKSEINLWVAAEDSASHTENTNNEKQNSNAPLDVKSEIRDPKSEIADVLLVSGRVSFEIVSKAYRAGMGFVLGVSAPTSMAVAEAARLGITLLAFCREDRATVYSHWEFVSGP